MQIVEFLYVSSQEMSKKQVNREDSSNLLSAVQFTKDSR